MSVIGDRPHDDTAPCVGCGMCCDGTLYSVAQVTPGEEPRLAAHGLTLSPDQSDPPYFNLPCHHESCGQCTIYHDRFDICRSFRCRLLRSYQANELTLSEALEKVVAAKALAAAVGADAPETRRVKKRQEVRRELANFPEGENPQSRADRARQLLRIIALDTYLDRWFRNPKSQIDAPLPDANS